MNYAKSPVISRLFHHLTNVPLPLGMDGAFPLPSPDGQLPPLLWLLEDGPFDVFLDILTSCI